MLIEPLILTFISSVYSAAVATAPQPSSVIKQDPVPDIPLSNDIFKDDIMVYTPYVEPLVKLAYAEARMKASIRRPRR